MSTKRRLVNHLLLQLRLETRLVYELNKDKRLFADFQLEYCQETKQKKE